MVIMLYFVGLDKIWEVLKESNPLYILLAFIVQIISYFLLTLRWRLVNKSMDIDIGFKELFFINLAGLAVNNLTPSARGGGEPVRAYLLTKRTDNCNFQTSFATVISDRALDMFPFIFLSILTIIGLIFYFKYSIYTVAILSTFVVIVCLLFMTILYICIDEKAGIRLVSWILKIIRKFYKKNEGTLEDVVFKALKEFQYSIKLLLTDKKVLYFGIPLSAIIWLFEILRVYLIFLAFSSSVSPLLIGGVFIISTLVGMIPLLPGGLGAIDGLMIGLYSTGGVTPSVSAAVTVIERLISFWFTSLLGLIFLSYYGTSLSETIELELMVDKKCE